MKYKITLVFDIGKTHIKAILFNQKGEIEIEYNELNKYFAVKNKLNIIVVDKIYKRIVYLLKKISKNYIINKIIFTTHASIAVLNKNEKDFSHFPVIDYENIFEKNFEKSYLKYQKCNFDETLTPNFNDGLVLSKTIYYYLQKKDNFPLIKSILFYPQYFAWRLSGIKSTDLTYLGCHSDLWSFKKNNFSTFVYKNKLKRKIPTIRNSWSKLGFIKKELVNPTKINSECKIYSGVHDSSACYFLYQKLYQKKFTLISTGTWIVIFNQTMKTKYLDEKKEIFSKLNVFGQKVPVIRFMGGREFSTILKNFKIKNPLNKIDIKYYLKHNIYPIPSFANGGPNKNKKGKIINKKLLKSKDDLYILASLYVALFTDYCLDLVDSKNTLIIDGGFVENKFFLYFLSIFRNKQLILVNKDSNGTAKGAFLLCNKNIRLKLNFEKLKRSSNNDLIYYKKEWRKQI